MEMVAGKKIDGRSSNVAVKAAMGAWLLTAVIWAQAFSFEVGGAVATQDFAMKSAAFAFRTAGCADPAKAEVSATGEGVVDGVRKSLPLAVHSSSKPGVWAIAKTWNQGKWVVVLKGSCGDAKAGAIVPVRGSVFAREGVKLYSRAPTSAEIEAAIKANQ